MKYAENTGAIAAYMNFAYAYLFLILLFIMPVFFILFYKRNFASFYITKLVNADDDEMIRRSKTIKGTNIGSNLNDLEKVETLCKDFYQTGEMDDISDSILKAANNGERQAILKIETDSGI